MSNIKKVKHLNEAMCFIQNLIFDGWDNEGAAQWIAEHVKPEHLVSCISAALYAREECEREAAEARP